MKTQKPPEVRPPWHRERVTAPHDPVSLAEQGHREACDINAIIKRQALGAGILGVPREYQYADVTGFQGKGYDELLLEARETLDAAGKLLEKQKIEEAEAQKKKIDDMEAELASLKIDREKPDSQPV